ncbi:hypothetical protein [Massilia niastensis]|uniref:hypothetical protein n=1 Tax=Massilia niastensis TaxID=544911 RepID=UPI001E5EF009|nr:hypothetical protein [Massilia niastensis]
MANLDPAPPPAPAPAPQSGTARSGLSSSDQVVELADQLSSCADQLHERIMREIRSYQGRTVPDKVQAAMRKLLEDELLLRQRASSLYVDAAAFVVQSLGKPQSHLTALTADAAEKIRRIGLIGEVTSLVAGLLALAGAAATGRPAPILLALEKIHRQVKAIEALAPTPPTPPTAAG